MFPQSYTQVIAFIWNKSLIEGFIQISMMAGEKYASDASGL